MPVKYFSRAGLMLTDWCNARCASCYLACGPGRSDWMPLELGLSAWEGLQSACPHGCRVHLTGGEPFGRFELLEALARGARQAGLGPLESVETNGFWATDDGVIRERLGALDAAGMGRLAISADPFHQQFVPIDRVRRLAARAEELLGPGRVRVRWADWLEEGFDLAGLEQARRRAVFAEYLAGGRDRLNGRACARLAGLLPGRPVGAFAGQACREPLLRGRHVHVLPDGSVMPGVCAGIVLGQLRPGEPGDVAELWAGLGEASRSGAVLGSLVRGGPVKLAGLARAWGFVPDPGGYASKCHLCWSVRRVLWQAGAYPEELAPASVYGLAPEGGP